MTTPRQLHCAIRAAIPGEAQVLTDIAHAAKRHWGYPEPWIARWRDDLTVTPQYIDRHDVYVAEADGALHGFYALTGEADHRELDHLWVHPSALGAGVGRVLYAHAVAVARRGGARTLVIDADPNAAGFYERMGARRTGAVPASMDGVERARPQYTVDLGDA